MLKLLVRNLDICQVSKMLTKNKLKATVTNETIIIHSDKISNEIIDELFENVTIVGVQNYEITDEITSEDSALEEVDINVSTEKNVKVEGLKDLDEEYLEELETQIEQPKKTIHKHPIYRGEVYRWGTIKEDEETDRKIRECVIIIQSRVGRYSSGDTIVLFCTTRYKERAQISFHFAMSEDNMIDYNYQRLESYNNSTIFVGHIRGVNQSDLGEYLGTMTDSFMNDLQPIIDYCLGLKRSRTVNWAQLQILSNINIKEIFEITNEKISNSDKATKILELFGFDMNRNGTQYVKQAILAAYNMHDYRLEDLAQIVAKNEHVDAKEVLRLIVTRIKENFELEKSPAISFIRLVDSVLKKG